MWFDTLVLQLRLHMAYRVNGILYRLRFLRLPYENSFAKTLGLVLAVLREIFGMLLGMTGFFGHLFNLPLDIRHVAFSSANLGYAAVSGDIGAAAFIYGMIGVLAIGTVNLIVSFVLALYVALRSRGTEISSMSNLIKNVWAQVKTNPLQLVYPVQIPSSANGNGKDNGDQKSH